MIYLFYVDNHDTQYVVGAPTGLQWTSSQPGIAYLSRTGTITVSANNNFVSLYGMTFSAVPSTVEFGSSVYFDALSEL